MKKIINTLLLCLILTGCTSVEYVQPSLPDFNPVRPARPQLEEVNEEVPQGAVINTVRLMNYSRELEIYSNTWESFYNQLKEDIKLNDSVS